MAILTRSELRRIKQIEKIIGQTFQQNALPDGMDICEIQLYHLVSKIKETDINPAIERFLPPIRDVLEGLSRDELIQKMATVEFSRFYEFYSKATGIEPAEKGKTVDTASYGKGYTRYFINLGERDDFDWMSLKDVLKKVLGLGKEDIFHVDVKESFSFFNTDASLTPLVLEAFQGHTFQGRPVHVEISSAPKYEGQGGRKKQGKGGRSKGKKGYIPDASFRKKTKKGKKTKGGSKGRKGR